MARYKVISIGLTVVFLLMVFAPIAQGQSLLIDALKVFGIGYVVSRFGGEINRFVNNVADQRGIEWEGATKVVPIASVGAGTYIGAAQVVGDPNRVGFVRAVAQAEARISGIQGRYLIPISTSRPGRSGLSRVEGVGISALLDFRI